MRPVNPIQAIYNFVDQVAESMGLSLNVDKRLWVALVIAWTLPPQGWVKLNSDGTFKANTSSARCGGLDSYGKCLIRYAKPREPIQHSKLNVEGLYVGFNMLGIWDIRVQLECDSKALILAIMSSNSSACYLVHIIQQMLEFY